MPLHAELAPKSVMGTRLAAAALLGLMITTGAQPETLPEEAVKAAYIPKFIPFITLPDTAVTMPDTGLKAHGMIRFVTGGTGVRFDIDDAAAAEGGVVISSKLLNLARAVKPRGQS